MILTIKNSKASVYFRSLSPGDFFVQNGDLHMKLPSRPGHGSCAFRFSGAQGIVDIGGGTFVVPVKVVEIVVEQIN